MLGLAKVKVLRNDRREGKVSPGAPLPYFNDEGGGGCGPSVSFGSEILAKSDFFGSMKDTGICLGCENRTKGFFGCAKKGLREFLGYAKKD